MKKLNNYQIDELMGLFNQGMLYADLVRYTALKWGIFIDRGYLQRKLEVSGACRRSREQMTKMRWARTDTRTAYHHWLHSVFCIYVSRRAWMNKNAGELIKRMHEKPCLET